MRGHTSPLSKGWTLHSSNANGYYLFLFKRFTGVVLNHEIDTRTNQKGLVYGVTITSRLITAGRSSVRIAVGSEFPQIGLIRGTERSRSVSWESQVMRRDWIERGSQNGQQESSVMSGLAPKLRVEFSGPDGKQGGIGSA